VSSQKASAWRSSHNQDKKAPRPSRCVLPKRDHREGKGFDERRDRPNSRRPTGPRHNSDEEALALRDSGHSYAAVARSLGFKRAIDARGAFLRALRHREGEEKTSLIQRESARLDKLETRIRTRDADDPEKMERRLVALAKMRDGLG
jgi:hypothetical protein